jgi:LacI family transcriptional regulator, repressor for deo operon, udp, cdd, tsx, nupC, and nupG
MRPAIGDLMPSLKDIAQATGVSIRTVSRVVNKQKHVKPAIRAKVEKVIERLGYTPNPIARSLSMGRTFDIAVLATGINPLHLSRFSSMESHFRANGHRMYLRFRGLDEDPLKLIQEIIQVKPAGVVFSAQMRTPVKPLVNELTRHKIPCISFECEESGVDSILVDRPQGVYDAIHYLARRGRERIAYLGPMNETRLSGYNRAMKELKLKPIYLDFEWMKDEEIFARARRIGATLKERCKKLPDAIQCFSDHIAMGLLAGLDELNIKVPQEIAVVGFDNRPMAAFASPPLTTVAQPGMETGIAAAEVLLKKINGEPKPKGGWSRSIPTQLFIRESA